MPVVPCAVTGPCPGSALEGVEKISAGPRFFVVIMTHGKEAISWGANQSGQLGQGEWIASPPGIERAAPVCAIEEATRPCINPLLDVIETSSSYEHDLALLENPRWAVSFGANERGQLGDNDNTGPEACQAAQPCSMVPVHICEEAYSSTPPCPGGSYLEDGKAVSSGRTDSLVLLGTGEVRSFGSNPEGLLGDDFFPLPTESLVPVAVCKVGFTPLNATCLGAKRLKGIKAVSAGDDHNLALAGSYVDAWGADPDGQLGDGLTAYSAVPLRVCEAGAPGTTGACPSSTEELKKAAAISAGGRSSLAMVK